jgi:hypothetical protein
VNLLCLIRDSGCLLCVNQHHNWVFPLLPEGLEDF